MSNLLVQVLTRPVVTTQGLVIAPEALFSELTPFVREIRDIAPGTEGFPLVSREELDRFTAGGQDRDSQQVGSVTKAIRVAEDRWILAPDDDDDADHVTFQSFEFVAAENKVLFVPTIAEIALPDSTDELLGFLTASRESRLWRGLRARKQTAVCVDTDAGDCFGEECDSGCAKLTWGDPDAPEWSCVCPGD